MYDHAMFYYCTVLVLVFLLDLDSTSSLECHDNVPPTMTSVLGRCEGRYVHFIWIEEESVFYNLVFVKICE